MNIEPATPHNDSTESQDKQAAAENKEYRVANYYIAMAVSIVLLYILNNIRYMNLKVFAEEFTSCLWAINLALGITIMGNFFLLLYRPRWFHHLTQAVISLLIVFAFYIVYMIFPFNLSSGIFRNGLRIILIGVMVIVAIDFVIEVIKFFKYFLSRHKHLPHSENPASIPPQPPA